MVLLHFFGLGNGLRRFELEQITGLNLMGFRPVTLDQLVMWSQEVAAQQRWDVERIHNDVVEVWMDQAEEINQWRHRLRQAPHDVQLLAGIGDLHSWQRHWEGMLRQTPPGNRA